METPSLTKLISTFFLLITISIFLLLADNLKLLNFPKNIISTITTPVNFGIYNIYQKTDTTFGFLGFWKNGYSEISYLKQRNEELAVTAQNAAELKKENEILKAQFSQTPAFAQNLLPARVVGLERYLYLDKGEKDGVKLNDSVVLNSLIVGKINKVLDRQSQVLLLTDPEAKTAVISSTNRSKGILEGTFGTGLLLTHVATGDKIDAEETVEAWGGQEYPSGFLVGKIMTIDNKSSELFKTASVQPLVDYNKLTTVFILLN